MRAVCAAGARLQAGGAGQGGALQLADHQGGCCARCRWRAAQVRPGLAPVRTLWQRLKAACNADGTSQPALHPSGWRRAVLQIWVPVNIIFVGMIGTSFWALASDLNVAMLTGKCRAAGQA